MMPFARVTNEAAIVDCETRLKQARRRKRALEQLAEGRSADDLLADHNLGIVQELLSSSSSSASESHLEKERLAFYQYGVEVRHLPLFRYLQTANFAVPTWAWLVARRELAFSKVFDRVAELRLLRAWGPSQALNTEMAIRARWGGEIEEQVFAASPVPAWDAVLRDVPVVQQADVAAERRWKMAMAAKLAEEATSYLSLKRHHVARNTAMTYSRERLEASLALELALHQDGDAPMQTPVKNPRSASFVEELLLATPPSTPRQPVVEFAKPLPHVISSNPQSAALNWTRHEAEFVATASGDPRFVAFALNARFHRGRSIRSARDVESLLHNPIGSTEHLPDVDSLDGVFERTKWMHAKDSRSAPPPNTKLHTPTCTIKRAKKNPAASSGDEEPSSPQSQQPAPITITFSVHPSHETALRKANLTLTKQLLTPNELAMRRVQRSTAPASIGDSSSTSSMAQPQGTNPSLPLAVAASGAVAGGMMMVFRPPATTAQANPAMTRKGMLMANGQIVPSAVVSDEKAPQHPSPQQ